MTDNTKDTTVTDDNKVATPDLAVDASTTTPDTAVDTPDTETVAEQDDAFGFSEQDPLEADDAFEFAEADSGDSESPTEVSEASEPDANETPASDTVDASSADPEAKAPTFFEQNFAGYDFGENSKYYHVYFTALTSDGNRIYGTTPIYSEGIFNLESVRQSILADDNLIDAVIASWQEFATLEEFNAAYGEAVDDTGEGMSYYHIHYILNNAEGSQVFGSTPAQTSGFLNLPSIKEYVAGLYNTDPASVVITNWVKLDSIEVFAQLNSFTINEPTPQQ